MIHDKCLAIIVTYEMNRDVYKFKMNTNWTNTIPVSFYIFREKLSTHILRYDPRKRYYTGDECMCVLVKIKHD